METLTLPAIAHALRHGDFSAVDLVEHYLEKIRTRSDLNAFITTTTEQAREGAHQADRAIAKGVALREAPMLGIPVAHKDIFCTDGILTSCGSRMLKNFIAPYDATVVTQFKAAKSPLLGKTNMDEFAMGSSNETSYFGPVINPWNSACVPGGSSGGSAAAVAAGLAPISTGTDTGGSIRLPAAFCGVSGLKPTYGRVSRYGMIAFASSFDQGGLIARHAIDIAWALATMAGFDEKDSTSMQTAVPDYSLSLQRSITGLRLGLPKQFLDERLAPEIAECLSQAIAVFEKLGAKVREVDLPNTHLAIPTYYLLASAECSSNLARFDGVRYGHRSAASGDMNELFEQSRSEGFGTEVKRRIMLGTYGLRAGYYDAYYRKAQEVRRLIANDYQCALAENDLLIGPTSPTVAFELGDRNDDPVSMYLCDVYTTGVNLAGLPAMSIPAGFVNQLPVGLQLIGNHFQEARLLNVAHQFQLETDWHQYRPEHFASVHPEGES